MCTTPIGRHALEYGANAALAKAPAMEQCGASGETVHRARPCPARSVALSRDQGRPAGSSGDRGPALDRTRKRGPGQQACTVGA